MIPCILCVFYPITSISYIIIYRMGPSIIRKVLSMHAYYRNQRKKKKNKKNDSIASIHIG